VHASRGPEVGSRPSVELEPNGQVKGYRVRVGDDNQTAVATVPSGADKVADQLRAYTSPHLVGIHEVIVDFEPGVGVDKRSEADDLSV
jgi:hypothetical protein